MAVTFDSVAAVQGAVGTDLGRSDWLRIEQSRIDRFAEATGDHQWIHVDPERARAGPFGACVAHGYLTLSLANFFLPQLLRYERLKMGVNYGCERVRFPAPVKVGARIRGRGAVVAAEDSAREPSPPQPVEAIKRAQRDTWSAAALAKISRMLCFLSSATVRLGTIVRSCHSVGQGARL